MKHEPIVKRDTPHTPYKVQNNAGAEVRFSIYRMILAKTTYQKFS